MAQKWNLQDIKPIQSRKRRVTPEPRAERELAKPQSDRTGVVRLESNNGNNKRRPSLRLALSVFFGILLAGFLASFLIGGADITVYPRHNEPNVNAVFTGFLTPLVGELAYEIMTLEADGERQVSATGEEEAIIQGKGTMFIYNDFSKNSLRLVKNTRFESSLGLIFKITESAVVPGYTIDEGGNQVPGMTTAEVFAEAPGEQYNISPAKFTIPGFEGKPEFDGVYGETTTAIAGGFEGIKFIIDDTELQAAKQALQQELKDALLQRLPNEQPAGFVVFSDAVTFTFESLPAVEYGENLATIKEKVVLRIPIFQQDLFSEYIAAATISGYEGAPVRINDYSKISFVYTSATTTISNISNVASLEFTLVGKPQIVWVYDEDELKKDLLNASKTALPAVLGGYPAILKAEAVIRPFWKRSFPKKLKDIRVTEVIE